MLAVLAVLTVLVLTVLMLQVFEAWLTSLWDAMVKRGATTVYV